MAEEPKKELPQFPPELLKKICNDCASLNDQLAMRATCPQLCKVLTPFIADLQTPDDCEIACLAVQKMNNTLHITVDVDNVATAQYFIALGDRAIKHWKKKDAGNGRMRCWFTFPFDAPRDFQFFEQGAKIAHFDVNTRLPFFLTPENVDWLNTLLQGCTITRLSLVLKAPDVPIVSVANLAAMVHAEHVELKLQSAVDIDEFARELAAAGVKEVTVTAEAYYTEVQLEMAFSFMNSGITNVTLDGNIASQQCIQFGGVVPNRRRLCYVPSSSFEKFFRDLAATGQAVRLLIRSKFVTQSEDARILQASPDLPAYVTNVNPCARGADWKELLITMQ